MKNKVIHEPYTSSDYLKYVLHFDNVQLQNYLCKRSSKIKTIVGYFKYLPSSL